MENFGFDKFKFICKLESGAVDGTDYSKAMFEEGENGKFTVNLKAIAEIGGNKNTQPIKITGTKKDKLDIKIKVGDETKKVEGVLWDNREDYLADATRTFTFKIGEDETKFMTTYDLARHFQENWEEIKQKKFFITGSIMFIAMNGKIYPTYKVESIYDIEEEAEDKLELEVNMLLNSMSTKMNLSVLKKMKPEERQVPVNAMIKTLLIKNNKMENKYADFQFKITLAGVDLEEDAELIEVINELYTLDYTKPMKPVKMKTGKWYKTTVIGNIINAQKESEEFDISTLPPQVQKLIKLGALSEEDAKKQMKIRGEYVRDIYLTFPKIDSVPVTFAVEEADILDLEAEEVNEDSVENEIKKQTEAKKVVEEEAEEEEEAPAMDRMAMLKAKLSGK